VSDPFSMQGFDLFNEDSGRSPTSASPTTNTNGTPSPSNSNSKASTPNGSSSNGLLDRPPSVATVQTLSLMAVYEGICSHENSIETTWTLMGLASKLAQSVSLRPFLFFLLCFSDAYFVVENR